VSEFTLRIDGMSCGSCVRRVSQALSQTQGLDVKEVRIGAARIASADDPAPPDHAIARAIAALSAAGYKAHAESDQPGS